ncbi:hypothetical protein J6590_066339 [Homalodisca vitripennis]|nr:hypothetical protein J6590_066339 [Homalodisca vitripennis]
MFFFRRHQRGAAPKVLPKPALMAGGTRILGGGIGKTRKYNKAMHQLNGRRDSAITLSTRRSTLTSAQYKFDEVDEKPFILLVKQYAQGTVHFKAGWSKWKAKRYQLLRPCCELYRTDPKIVGDEEARPFETNAPLPIVLTSETRAKSNIRIEETVPIIAALCVEDSVAPPCFGIMSANIVVRSFVYLMRQ